MQIYARRGRTRVRRVYKYDAVQTHVMHTCIDIYASAFGERAGRKARCARWAYKVFFLFQGESFERGRYLDGTYCLKFFNFFFGGHPCCLYFFTYNIQSFFAYTF